VTVRDSGSGMSPEVMARMFEPFFTTKEIGKGTGLGLSIVHSVVQQHDGWIRVRSKPGAGTEFAIFLPMAVAEAAVEPVAEKLVGGNATILLVEDEAIVREACAAVLRGLGYTVLEANSGPHALESWGNHQGRVDLLVSDMVMPGKLSGLHVAECLRRENPALKVVIISGYNEEIIKSGDIQAQGIAVLPKPFEIGALAAMIQRMLHAPGARPAGDEREPAVGRWRGLQREESVA
jgi:CheY-like chemotaxis protein